MIELYNTNRGLLAYRTTTNEIHNYFYTPIYDGSLIKYLTDNKYHSLYENSFDEWATHVTLIYYNLITTLPENSTEEYLTENYPELLI